MSIFSIIILFIFLKTIETKMKTKEIIFIIEESLDSGFEAKAVGFPIFTEGETEEEIKKNLLEAVRCHFDENEMLSYITIRFLRDEQIAI